VLTLAFKGQWDWMVIFTCVIALATIGSAVIGWFQWSAIRGQLAEMQAEQQPWVFAKTGIVPRAVAINANGSVRITMSFDLKNVGHLPAQNVFPYFIPYIRDMNFAAARQTVCNRAENLLHGITIFPGDTIPWGSEEEITKDEIDQATNLIPPDSRFIAPI